MYLVKGNKNTDDSLYSFLSIKSIDNKSKKDKNQQITNY